MERRGDGRPSGSERGLPAKNTYRHRDYAFQIFEGCDVEQVFGLEGACVA
jgi:hypothetical protein